jgi:hypothetical protein
MQNKLFFLTIGVTFIVGWGCTIKEGEVEFEDAGYWYWEGEDAGLDTEDAAEVNDRDSGADSVGEDAAGGEDSSAPVLPTVEGMPSRFAQAICSAIEDCEGSEYLTLSLRGDDCVEHTAMVFENRDYHYLEESVDAGRVIFDAESVAQCLSDIRAQGCEVTNSREPESCQHALQGTVDVGANCVIDADCAGDAFCGSAPGVAECPTVCNGLLAEGGACERSDQCENGLVCAGGTCASPPTEGETCCLAESDQSCWDTAPAPCKRGLECTSDSSTQATCKKITDVRKAKEGETCEPPILMCEVNGDKSLACLAIDSSTGICREKVEVGGTCQAAQPSQCPVGQYCEAADLAIDGTCVDLPDRGEPCREEGKSVRCAPGLVCDLYSGDPECVPINSNGFACASDRGCFSGICGDEDNCVAPAICE